MAVSLFIPEKMPSVTLLEAKMLMADWSDFFFSLSLNWHSEDIQKPYSQIRTQMFHCMGAVVWSAKTKLERQM